MAQFSRGLSWRYLVGSESAQGHWRRVRTISLWPNCNLCMSKSSNLMSQNEGPGPTQQKVIFCHLTWCIKSWTVSILFCFNTKINPSSFNLWEHEYTWITTPTHRFVSRLFFGSGSAPIVSSDHEILRIQISVDLGCVAVGVSILHSCLAFTYHSNPFPNWYWHWKCKTLMKDIIP